MREQSTMGEFAGVSSCITWADGESPNIRTRPTPSCSVSETVPGRRKSLQRRGLVRDGGSAARSVREPSRQAARATQLPCRRSARRGIDCSSLSRHGVGHRRYSRRRGDDWAFISSGTWSLVGCVLDSPCLSKEARQSNFSNEGGIGGRINFLKNVNGMWLLQQCIQHWRSKGRPGRLINWSMLRSC